MTEVKRKNAVKIEGRQYIVVSPDLDNDWVVGTILTLSEDDGTNLPWFTDKSGNGGYIYMHEVMLLAETVEKVEEPIKPKLPEHKYIVGQKLTANRNNDIWTCYPEGEKVTVKTIEGHWGDSNIPRYLVTSVDGASQLMHEGQLEPVAPYITEEQYAAIEVGDTIVIRDDLEIGKYGEDSVTYGMLQEKGKQLTVKSGVGSGGLRVEESIYNWTQQMIAEVIKKEIVTEKPEFLLEEGQFYLADQTGNYSQNWIIKAGEITDDSVEMGFALSTDNASYTTWGELPFSDVTKWTPATDEQKIKLLTAMAEHGDATDSDLELLSELMPLDNPELEAGAVYFRQGGAIIRAHQGDTVESGLRGNFYEEEDNLFIAANGSRAWVDHGHRKALPHEVAKLEAAEKERGCEYKKPLINSKGTVIEVGQYYKS